MRKNGQVVLTSEIHTAGKPAKIELIADRTQIKADGKEMEVSTLYGNYKKLEEGILYPMSVTSGYGLSEVTKLEINPKIDETLFKPTVTK